MGLIKTEELKKCKTTKEIINKMFNFCYSTTQIVDINPNTLQKKLYPGKVDNFNGKRNKTFGYYLRHKKIKKEKETCFDTFFKATENIYYKLFNTTLEKEDMEEHLQQARLVALETLYNFVEKENMQADTFLKIITNEEKGKLLYTYLLKIIKNKAYKSLYQEGNRNSSSRDYYTKRIQKNNVRKTEKVKLNYTFLDSYGSTEELNNYSILDIHFQKEGKLNNLEDLFFSEAENNTIFKYILNNKEKIFTKSQLNKLEQLIANGSPLGEGGNKKARETAFIKKTLEKLSSDNYCQIKNGIISLKNIKLIEQLEKIINSPTPLHQFNHLKNFLIIDKNNIFADLVTGLETNTLKNLNNNLKNLDTSWLHTNQFKQILAKIVKEYNYQIKNKNLNFNPKLLTISKEEKIKNYIEKNCFLSGMDFGLVAKSKGGSIPNLSEIKDFFNLIYSSTLEKNDIRDILLAFGYNVDITQRTTKNKVPCYKVFKI